MFSEDSFYDNCPNLTQQSQDNMDADFSLQELLTALMTCMDSAPGSDGIPYSVYKKVWSIYLFIYLARIKKNIHVRWFVKK